MENYRRLEKMHDGKLDIAVGHGARSRKWKRKEMTWLDLVDKLADAHRTAETQREYFKASKAERSKIKDVGGYVGGYLRGARRKQENVVHRQLVTLDIDYAHAHFWTDFILEFDNAAVLHTTHSHTEENPRFRLIMPLSREVTPDEYVPVARRIAGNLDIELFDVTTFQTHRLMYWPSVSSDADYGFQFQDGNWVDVDELLDSYIDWKDSTLWPTSVKQLEDVERLSKKQEDPEFKRGIIGAFCRTYTITEAIETHLPDVYTHVDNVDDRFTYVNGSTAAGLVLYEDKFAYSHHGTDPCGGKLCNAFDLVRIHLFGHLDKDSIAAPSKLPSFQAMSEFSRNDSEVKGTLALERFSEAKADFALTEEEAEANVEWAKNLELDGRGNYVASANNINIILANDPKLAGIFEHNEFDKRYYVISSPPWRKITEPEPLRSVDKAGIRNYIEVVYKISGKQKIEDALLLEFERHSFHPIKDYLDGLTWDGEERVDTFLIDYFGVEDNIYTREAIRKTLTGAVARIYKAGIKFDLVLTLIGSQGCGKSTLVYKLGKGWSSDTFGTVKGKEAFEQLQGAWLIEMAELSGLKKAEVESIKHFITKQEDMYRKAWGEMVETYKRQCVFIGTTNNKNFLRDPTGNRRFMPIDVDDTFAIKSIFDIEEETIDQIWAEAKNFFQKGEPLYLSEEANEIAELERSEHRDVDERAGIVESFLDIPITKKWADLDALTRQMYFEGEITGTVKRDKICIAEIWVECLGKSRADMTRYNTRDLNEIMRGMQGWEQQKSPANFGIYGKQKYFKRIN